MKSFLTNCLFFGILILAAFAGVGFLADGYTDDYYLRLTGPHQNALILGSSRAAQGLQPAVINQALGNEYPQHIYNFSFTIGFSPFGETYFNAIRKKLDNETKNSFFIVSVDPWCIAADKKIADDPALFSEKKSFLGKLPWINTTPNFLYLAKYYENPYLSLLTVKIHRKLFDYYPPQFLHDDGWLEISAPMDSFSVKQRVQKMFPLYRSFQATETISGNRISWLIKTIAFLKQHGDVYLVRLPVPPGMLAIENEFCPAFDTTIQNIARQQQVPYFNLTPHNAQYNYTDGTHLWKASGALVSKQLADLVIQYRHAR